ncbi:MAG TPA: type IV pilin protein [Burkholderiaceae bacterium]|nr:type IV pilin protein [Burkholderiaceae bacterium]
MATKQCAAPRRSVQRGFTLIELMITVAIVGILAAVALPAYSGYVLRSHLTYATDQLSTSRTLMEQYYQDNRQYTSVSAANPAPCSAAVTAGDFSVICTTLTATTYTITATAGATTLAKGFTYTIDQAGNMTSTVPAAFDPASPYACWIVRQGTTC